MSYVVEPSEEALRRFSGYSPAERQAIADALDRLAESPTRLSRPSYPPAELPNFQVYEFWHNGNICFKIFFKYGSDEQTLHIYSFGRIEYGN